MFTLTEYGREAISAAASGDTKILFHSIKTTDATEPTPPEDNGGFEGLGPTKQTAYISNVTWDKGNDSVVVTAVVSNKDLVSAYNINGIGLYAECKGLFNNPVKLLGYEYLETSDVMPLPTRDIVSYTYSIVIKIANAEGIDFTLEDGTYAAAADVQNLTELVQTNAAKFFHIRLNNTTSTKEKQGFYWAQEVSAPGVTSEYFAIAFVSSGTYPATYIVETAENKLRLWFETRPGTSTYVDIVCFPTYT